MNLKSLVGHNILGQIDNIIHTDKGLYKMKRECNNNLLKIEEIKHYDVPGVYLKNLGFISDKQYEELEYNRRHLENNTEVKLRKDLQDFLIFNKTTNQGNLPA